MQSKDSDNLEIERERLEKTELRRDDSDWINASAINKLEILERLTDLEEKVFKKNSRLELTLNQKMLLLKHSGLLEHVQKVFKNVKDKSNMNSFLSFLLDEDRDNIKKALLVIHYDDPEKSVLERARNYEVLVKVFKESGIVEMESFCNERLNTLSK